MPTRILITGAGGMLGQDVGDAAAGELEVVGLTHAGLDITDSEAVDDAIGASSPDVVVNCAAWTDVDGAESAPAEAAAVNATGAGHVARSASAVGAWTIHISSDYVFDGSKRTPYVESDPARPLSVYGRSKLEGEVEVMRNAPQQHTVVRSSWLFGTRGRCFPASILERAAAGDELAVVDDQCGSPTFTAHLARALIRLIESGPPVGIIHLAGAGSCSWFELASRALELAGLDCRVTPARTEEMARPAVRPAYSVLESERPEAPRLPHWHQGLEEFLAVRV